MSYASNNEIFLAVQLDDYGIKQRANSTETEQEASSNTGSFLSINPKDQVMSVGIAKHVQICKSEHANSGTFCWRSVRDVSVRWLVALRLLLCFGSTVSAVDAVSIPIRRCWTGLSLIAVRLLAEANRKGVLTATGTPPFHKRLNDK